MELASHLLLLVLSSGPISTVQYSYSFDYSYYDLEDYTCHYIHANLPYRGDYRCGEGWLALNGEVARCDPEGIYPCCSAYNWCGFTQDHCDCEECIDYRTFSEKLPYRDDHRCGEGWLAPNGEVARCDPEGIYPCCSAYNWCGITQDHCDCEECIDYRNIYEEGSIRLVGGNETAGRVEVYLNGEWGTVCDDSWDLSDAVVVCRQLGFSSALSASSYATFGQGDGSIVMDNVACTGTEYRLTLCSHLAGPSDCYHYEDAGVVCSVTLDQEGSIRLAGGNDTAGRVEIYLNGEWGTVCDDSWDLNDAWVVCKQLGFVEAISAPSNATFGQGEGSILIDDVACTGTESKLTECSYDAATPYCSPSENGGIVCVPFSGEVNQNTIVIGEPLVERHDSKWTLKYSISWQPPIQNDNQDLSYRVAVSFEPKFNDWYPFICGEAQLRYATDVSNPSYEVELPFSHTSMFQVAPTVDGSHVSDMVTRIIFETPDCYEATNDSDFCAKQDVVTSGAPYKLLAQSSERINLFLEWRSPVQINRHGELLEYKVQIISKNGAMIYSHFVGHKINMTKYSLIPMLHDWELEEGLQYVFTVTPFASINGIRREGKTATLPFWTNDTEIATDPPTTTDGPLLLPVVTHSNSGVVINLIIIFLVIFVGVVIFAVIATRKGLFKAEEEEEVFYRIKRTKINIYTELLMHINPVLEPKEICHDKVTLQYELGKGQFGIVYKGLIYGINGHQEYVEAAVKTTKDGAFADVKEDLLDEMKLMIQLGSHPNLMTLLACCTQREPYYLITEFMEYGDLLTFLRKCREKDSAGKDSIYNVGEIEQLGIAHQIAKGMAYVQEKGFYHGDLAARNVLVGWGLTVKISDFGLADNIYSRGYKRREQDQKIPIKWCSIEAILNGICSSEGDVWSYGVVLFEIFTLGGTPYPGLASRFLVAQLREGYRMDQPQDCPDDLYKIMLHCWEEVPENRPRFETINQHIDAMLVERSDYLCFGLEDECEEICVPLTLSDLEYTCNHLNVRPAGNVATSDNFAPIIEEDNDIDLDELQDILHSETKQKKDVNDNV